MPGAFTKDLEARGAERPLLFQHRHEWLVGRALLNDSPEGLRVRGLLTTATQMARDAAALVADGLLTGISIGFDTVKQKYDGGTRRLVELKVYEVSLVTLAVQPLAAVTSKGIVAAAVADMRARMSEIRSLVLPPRPASTEVRVMNAYQQQIEEIRSWARRERRAHTSG